MPLPRIVARRPRDRAWALSRPAVETTKQFGQSVEIEKKAGVQHACQNLDRAFLLPIPGKPTRYNGIVIGPDGAVVI